jgi:hypothetical protein
VHSPTLPLEIVYRPPFAPARLPEPFGFGATRPDSRTPDGPMHNPILIRLRHFGGISPARPLRIHTPRGAGTLEVKSFFKIIESAPFRPGGRFHYKKNISDCQESSRKGKA